MQEHGNLNSLGLLRAGAGAEAGVGAGAEAGFGAGAELRARALH